MTATERPVVLVTGASSGIGAAVSRAYGARGSRVCLVARRVERLQNVADDVRAEGGEALVAAGDVTRDGDLDRAVAMSLERWGRVDTVVANAGFGVAGRIVDLSIDDYRRQFDTNVHGVVRTVHAALPALRASRGRCAIVGSVAGFVASPGTSPYCMSKFAVRAFATALRHEVRPLGISVTHVAPGFVESEIRLRRDDGSVPADAEDPVPSWLVMRADRAARIIVRAVERRKPEVVVTAHGRLLAWLGRHMPFLIDVAMARGARRPGVQPNE